MREIPLTQNKFALVDDDDYEWLNQWKWYAKKCKHLFYAVRMVRHPKRKRFTVSMHRLISNTPRGMDVDHIDHDGLNNQRYNLRNCLRKENTRNSNKAKNRTTQYKGVYIDRNLIRASIRVDRKLMGLGTFQTQEDAAKAYDDAALEYFGRFAKLNF